MKRFVNNPRLKSRRQDLRNHSTNAEIQIWLYLSGSKLDGYKFRRQHGIGPYIVDFYCHVGKLIVEIDGGYHSQTQEYDKRRTVYLESHGYRVIRFNNEQIFDMNKVIAEIKSCLKSPPR